MQNSTLSLCRIAKLTFVFSFVLSIFSSASLSTGITYIAPLPDVKIKVHKPKTADLQITVTVNGEVDAATGEALDLNSILDLSLTVTDFNGKSYTSSVSSQTLVQAAFYEAVFAFPDANWTEQTHQGTLLSYELTSFTIESDGTQYGPQLFYGTVQFQ